MSRLDGVATWCGCFDWVCEMVDAAGVCVWITRVVLCDGRMLWCDEMVVAVWYQISSVSFLPSKTCALGMRFYAPYDSSNDRWWVYSYHR
jgi:hypothetical protein